MPKFSQHSRIMLGTVHPGLIRVANEAIKIVDFRVLSGYRGRVVQNDYYESGLSTKPYPESKHNRKPSEAIDVAPYPIDWEDRERFVHLAGIFVGIGHALNLKIRWGGDWDMDSDLRDQQFMDLGHFEILI